MHEVRDSNPKTYNLSPETFKSRLPKAVGFFYWLNVNEKFESFFLDALFCDSLFVY